MQLRACHSLHIVGRQFAVLLRLERLGILVVTRQQQLVAHADLVEQLAAARALRREVDESTRCADASCGGFQRTAITHGGTDG